MNTRVLTTLAVALLSSATAAANDSRWVLAEIAAGKSEEVELVGAPKIASVDGRKAVVFDGVKDGLLVKTNPLAGSVPVTVEILFEPASGGPPEQRFFHVQDVEGRRALLETRTDDHGRWWLDGFMRTSSDPADKGLPLIDPKLTFPVDRWYWVALRYDGHELATFVDGVKQCEGAGDFNGIGSGKISLGVRQNLVYWFKGAIAEVRFHREAVPEEKLQRVAH